MSSSPIRTAIACALISATLAACDPSDLPDDARITLPAPPADLRGCFARSFPEIPADRALTKTDVVRIIGGAKLLDRAKSACGQRAATWIDDVLATYARPPARGAADAS